MGLLQGCPRLCCSDQPRTQYDLCQVEAGAQQRYIRRSYNLGSLYLQFGGNRVSRVIMIIRAVHP